MFLLASHDTGLAFGDVENVVPSNSRTDMDAYLTPILLKTEKMMLPVSVIAVESLVACVQQFLVLWLPSINSPVFALK